MAIQILLDLIGAIVNALRLREIFLKGKLGMKHSQGAKNTDFEYSEMENLAKKHTSCILNDEVLHPCLYHQDRLEVMWYEQERCNGEVDWDERTVRLNQTPELNRLLSTMRNKLQIAGNWGLMKKQREWLFLKLLDFLGSKDLKKFSVLQCGIAGYVHYFANVRILTEVVKQLRDSSDQLYKIDLTTFDICSGSIRPIERLVEILANMESENDLSKLPKSHFEVDGYLVPVHPTFWDILKSTDKYNIDINHCLKVSDLTQNIDREEEGELYDVVLSHHLLSMWGENREKNVRSLCKNLSKIVKKDGQLYFAMNVNNINADNLSIKKYNEIFEEEGFIVKDAQLVWDIYDVNHSQIETFVDKKKHIDIIKDCALIQYSK